MAGHFMQLCFIQKQWIKRKETKMNGSLVKLGGAILNYSLEEQVVGTWIDGKPLYQKTFTGTSSSTAGKDIDTTIADNVERVIYVWGILDYDTTNKNSIPVGYFFNSNDFIHTWTVLGNILRFRTTYTSKPFILTVQYTKTTD